MYQSPIRSGAATSPKLGPGKMALPGCRPRPLHAPDSGLGVVEKARRRAGYQGTGHGLRATWQTSGSVDSLGSRVAGRIQPVVATPLIEVFMGRPAGWMQKLTGRGTMRSLGAPPSAACCCRAHGVSKEFA